MAGLYDWEKRADGTQNCDMLEVYSAGEKEKLKQTVSAKVLKHIMVVNNAFDGNTNGSEFIFSETLASIDRETSSEEEEEKEKEKEEKKEVVSAPMKKETVADQLDWMTINVEDI
jgi:hypothetical protein